MSERVNINPKVLDWLKSKDNVEFGVVPHSHLDYAWYRDRESSKMRELEAFEKTFKVGRFTLEQMITAKEYVDGGGKRNRRELKKMVREGRMELIGMYMQPDVFLSGDEHRFWNYEFGESYARELGGRPSEIDYLPDSFGVDENTPMILKEAGRKAFLFERGLDKADELGAVYWYEAPDGSRVPAIPLAGGYHNASGLTDAHTERRSVSPEEYRERQVGNATLRVYELMNQYGERYHQVDLPHMLLMNGNDFTKPDEDLEEVLEGVQQRVREESGIEGFKIHTTSIDNYVDLALKEVDYSKMKTFKGEMRSSKEFPILRGIESIRTYLKQDMQKVEARIYEAGALSALLKLARDHEKVGENDHATWQQSYGYQRAVEQLLPVGSHDTVSGCGTDDAYPLPLAFLSGAYNSAKQTARNSIAALADRQDGYGAYEHNERHQTIANLLPYDRNVVIDIAAQGDLEHDKRAKMIVTDADGSEQEHPMQVIIRKDTPYVVGVLPMKSLSSVQVRIEHLDGEYFNEYETFRQNFETSAHKLHVASDGTIELTDKKTGKTIHGLVIEDVGDCGDEYNFDRMVGDYERTNEGGRATVHVINDGEIFTEIEIRSIMYVPESVDTKQGVDRDVRVRSHKMVDIPVSTVVRMYKQGIDRVEFATTIDNKARDHRMRVIFDTPELVGTVRARDSYGLTTREAVPVHGEADWLEPVDIATSHNKGLVAAGSMALMNHGLHEYEALTNENGQIDRVALTLFRSSGNLSKEGLSVRKTGAGPGWPTPDAQMEGKHTFEYAVNFNGQSSAGELTRDMRDYYHKAEHGFGGVEDINNLLNIETSHPVEMATLRITSDDSAVYLRLVNADDKVAHVKLSGAFNEAVRANYMGKRAKNKQDMREFDLARGMVTIRLR